MSIFWSHEGVQDDLRRLSSSLKVACARDLSGWDHRALRSLADLVYALEQRHRARRLRHLSVSGSSRGVSCWVLHLETTTSSVDVKLFYIEVLPGSDRMVQRGHEARWDADEFRRADEAALEQICRVLEGEAGWSMRIEVAQAE